MKDHTMTDRLKIGLLGCGAIAQIAHLPALAKARNAELTAICDAAEDLLHPIADQYGIEARYTDHRAFLERADIDAVLLPVSHGFHAPLSIDCMEAGKHVLLEKPMAETVEECERMIEASERTGMRLQIACMKRHDPALQFARRFVREDMGDRLSVSGWYCDTAFHGEYVRSLALPLRGSSAQRRSPNITDDFHRLIVLGHGVHAIDLLRFFGGDIVAVTTRTANNRLGTASASLIEYANGAVGTFELICTVKMDWFEGLHIHGERGSVVAHVGFPYFKKPSDVRIFDARRGEYRTPACGDSDPYERQIEAFAEAILSGHDVSPNGYDGLAAQRVLEAIPQSAETGRRVVIPTTL